MVDLRKFLEAEPGQPSALAISQVGIVGSLVAGIGAFCPFLVIAGHHVTYFARGYGDGQYVVGAAFIGLIASTVRTRIVTTMAGIFILTLLYQDVGNAGGIFSRPVHHLFNTISIGWGVYVVAAGAALMVISSLIPRRRTV
jgi:hypothetical protein